MEAIIAYVRLESMMMGLVKIAYLVVISVDHKDAIMQQFVQVTVPIQQIEHLELDNVLVIQDFLIIM